MLDQHLLVAMRNHRPGLATTVRSSSLLGIEACCGETPNSRNAVGQQIRGPHERV